MDTDDEVRVLGLDLSLTQSGWAAVGGDCCWGVVKPKAKGAERLGFVEEAVVGLLDDYRPRLAVIEGYAYGAPQGMAGIAELGGVVRLALFRAGVPYIEVAPMTAKKFVTGSGRAEKDEVMMCCLKYWGVEVRNNNAADAFGLAMFGRCYLGQDGFLKGQEAVIRKYRKDHGV